MAIKSYDMKYFPNLFDYYSVEGFIDNEKQTVRIWDISGGQSADTLWTTKYNYAGVIIICFATDNIHSFENVKKRWILEAQLHAPGVPVILVATKSDLRAGNENCVTQQMGQQRADELGISSYVECSTKNYCESLGVILDEVASVVAKCPEITMRPFPSDVAG